MKRTALVRLGGAMSFLLLIVFPYLLTAQTGEFPQPEEPPLFKVYDRFGTKYDLADIQIPSNSEVAGIFRLHFADEDNGTTIGFDAGNGASRRDLLVKVFEDVTELIGGWANYPYNIPNPCANSSDPFPDCRLIEIDVRESGNSNTLDYDVQGSPYYKVTGLPEINSGAIWQYVQTGWDPFHLLPYETATFPTTGPALSPNFGALRYYHGWIQVNWAPNWNESSSTAPQSGELDLYTAYLREALHMLGMTSLITSNGNSAIGGTNPGVYTMWDLHLTTGNANAPLLDFDLDAGPCWNVQFDLPTAPFITNACPGPGIEFVAPGITAEVFSDNSFVAGENLEHFNCANPSGWVLNRELQPGVAQRYPNATEYNALCAIGYELSSTYGTTGSGVVLHPTSQSGVTHQNSNAQVVYNQTSCPQTRRIAATDDFARFANDANYNNGTWDNSDNFRVDLSGTINITDDWVLDNDYNAVSIACVPEIMIGGGQIVYTGATIVYTPDPGFTGTAVLRYQAVNSSGERSNTAYIFIRVENACTSDGTCGENLVCWGDFEDIEQCHTDVRPLSSSGRFSSLPTNSGIDGNTPDLMPSVCNQSCTNQVCYDNQTSNCWADFDGMQFLPSVNPDGGNQFANIRSLTHTEHIENLTFPLKRPLDGGCHELSFLVASGCSVNLNFIFSQMRPCPHQMNVGSLPGPISCSGTTDFVASYIETRPITPMWDIVNNLPQWQQITVTINDPALAGSEFLTVYRDVTTQGGTTIFLDNIEVIDCDVSPLAVSATPVNPNPCVGDVIQVNYSLSNQGTPINADFDVAIDLGSSTGELQIVPNSDFNAQGVATIAAGSNPFVAGVPINLTLDLLVTNNAAFGTEYCFDLDLPSNFCWVQAESEVCITTGTPTIEIAKNIVTLGPYHPGSTVTWEIELTNPTQLPVSDVVIQDVIPAGLINVTASGANGWTNSGTTYTSNPFPVPAQTTSNNPITLTISGMIDPNFGCGVIENCVEVIQGFPYCGPVTDCSPLSVTLSGPPIFSAAVQDASCHGACDGEILFSPAGAQYSIINPPSCYPGPAMTFTTNPQFDDLSAGTYDFLIYHPQTGCTEIHQVTVDQPGPFSATAVVDQPNCAGDCDGQISMAISGGVSPFSYTMGANTNGTGIFQNLCGNLGYHIVVTDDDGCTADDVAILWNPASLTAILSPQDETCGGACDGSLIATLSGGTPDQLNGYSWAVFTPGISTPVASGQSFSVNTSSVLCAGNNHLQITDANGCVEDFYFNIGGPTQFTVTLGWQDETCVGLNDGTLIADVNGGVAPLTYAWTGPNGYTANTASIGPLAPGQYCVTVTDANGCTSYQTNCHTIQAATPLVAGTPVILSPVTCRNECDAVIQFSASGGTPNSSFPFYTYTVINGPGVNPNQPFSVPFDQLINACPTTQALPYTIVVQDANGCTTQFDVDVPNPPTMAINAAAGINPSCFGVCDGGVVLTVNGGVPFENPTNVFYYEYTTDPVNGPWTQSQIDNLCGNGPHTVWVRDANGCVLDATVTLNEPDPLVFSTLQFNDESCAGACDGSVVAVADDGTPPYTYTLNPGPTQNNGTFPGLCAGIYDVLVTDANGCVFNQGNVIGTGGMNPWPKTPALPNIDNGRVEGVLQEEADDVHYITGWYEGTITFHTNAGPAVTLISNGGSDAFIAKYNECGVEWAFGFGSPNDDRSNAIHRLTYNNRIIIGGMVGGSWAGYDTYGTTLLPANASNGQALSTQNFQKGFVLQLDPVTGSPDWVWLANDNNSGISEVQALSEMEKGPICGLRYQNNLNLLGSNHAFSANNWDLAVASMEVNGISRAVGVFGTDGDDGFGGIDDVATNIDVAVGTGFLGGPNLTFWDNSLANAIDPLDGEEVFVALFVTGSNVDITGFNITHFGGSGNDRGNDVVGTVFDPASTVPGIFITGSFNTSLPFLNGPLATGGGDDAFVASLFWDLSRDRAFGSGGPSNLDAGNAIVMNPSGEIFAGGSVAGTTVNGFLSPLGSTGGMNQQEMWVTEFTQGPFNPVATYPNFSDLSSGNHNAIFDMDLGTNFIYTGGSFTGIHDFGGNVVTASSGTASPFLARQDYFGNFQPKIAQTEFILPQSTEESLFEVFPNPTSGEFTVRWTHDRVESLEVLDLSGRLIRRMEQLPEVQSQQLNLSQEAQGVYLIRLVTSNGVETQKLVKE